MHLIARFMRDKTECPHIIEPFFENAVVQTHKALDHLFKSTNPLQCIPLLPKPMVICTDTSQLLAHF